MTRTVPPAPATTTRLAGLDLLRGLAVALVMLRHALPDAFPGAGVVGVVMFFTLSGYLITGVLSRERAARGEVRLGRFYLRRVLRLLPPLLAMVTGTVAVTLLLDPLDDRELLAQTVAVALTWTANLPGVHTSAATFHLWTLATEEQFYLLWPWVLAWAARSRASLILGGSALICLAACSACLVWFREAPDLAYPLPTSWAVCFVVGGAAWWWQGALGPLLVRPRAAPVAALGALVVLGMVALRGSAFTYLLGGPAIAALTAVLLLTWGTRARVDAVALRPLVWLGTVSYAAYLWNYPLTMWLRPEGDAAGPVAAALTVLAAAASWRWVEQPVAGWWSARTARSAVG